jgi:stringent starvation protein B
MSDAPRMTSHRPYLLRALYEWIADNDMTPHLLVDATQPGVRVPPHTINDGKVVLNIAARAVAHLDMDNDAVAFTARFGGVSHAVIVPVAAVLAIYARETGQGMALPPEEDVQGGDAPSAVPGDDGDDTPPDDGGPPPKRGAHLRIVK